MTRTDFLRTLIAGPALAVAGLAAPRREVPALPDTYRGWLKPDAVPIVPGVRILDPITGAEIDCGITEALNIETGELQFVVLDAEGGWWGASKVVRRPFVFVDGAGQRWDSRDYAA